MIIRPAIRQVLQAREGHLANPGRLPWEGSAYRPSPGAPPVPPGPLLDYAFDTTLSRTSEASVSDLRDGWAFDPPPPWVPPATHRIFGDGAILIEGSRSNLALRSEEPGDAAWLSHLGASGSNGTATAPDGDTDAGTVTFPADADAALYQEISTGAEVTLSAWFRGAGTVRLAVRQNDGSTIVSSPDIPLTSEWVRHSFTAITAPSLGEASPRIMLLNGSDGAARTVGVSGVQCEEGTFATSYIRTAGAAATRGGEVCTLAEADVPAVMRTGKWAFDFWLPYSSSDAPMSYSFVTNWGNAGGFGLYRTVSALRMQPFLNNAGLATQQILDPVFSAGAKITVEFDVPALTWSVSGLTAGNASGLSMDNMVSDSPAGDSTVANGIVAFGGRRTGLQQASAILSQPRAL